MAMAIAACMLLPAASLHAQASVKLGVVNASYPSFSGTSSVTAAQIAPRIDWLHGLDQGFVEASWSQFSGGEWAAQISAREGHARPAGLLGVIGSDGSIEANLLNSGVGTGRIQEAIGVGRRLGVVVASLAVSGGVVRDTAGTFIPQFSGRAGMTFDGISLKAQRYEGKGARYTDIEAAAEARRLGFLSVSAGMGERFFAGSDWIWHGEVVAHPAEAVGIEVAAGRTPRSPEGFSAGDYFTAGLRLTYAPRVARPTIARAPAGTRVDFALGGREVSIAGDWNDWTPMPMTKSADGHWSAVLPVTSGAHKFALTVDGKTVVPRGVPKLPDGFGGEVGLLVVPGT